MLYIESYSKKHQQKPESENFKYVNIYKLKWTNCSKSTSLNIKIALNAEKSIKPESNQAQHSFWPFLRSDVTDDDRRTGIGDTL